MFQDKEKISDYQALMLVLASGIAGDFMVIASIAIKNAGRDGWISVLLVYSIATVLGLIMLKLGLLFPDRTIIQYLPKILGGFFGKLLGLIYIFLFLIDTIINYRYVSIAFAPFLVETPSIAIVVLMALMISYVMAKGFEVFARTLELLIPIVIFLIILIILLMSPNLEWKNLKPVMEDGFFPVLKGIPILLSRAIRVPLIMGLWLPCLNKRNKGVRAVLIGLPINGILFTILIIVTIAFSGIHLPVKQMFPFFYMSRYIVVAQFLSGFHSIFMMLWMAVSYYTILVFFYPAVVGFAQWLNLKDYKSLILPMSIITVVLSMVPPNVMALQKLNTLKNLYIRLPLGLLIPIIWLAARIRKLNES